MSIRPDRRKYLPALARELGSLSTLLEACSVTTLLVSSSRDTYGPSWGPPRPSTRSKSAVFQALPPFSALARTLQYSGVDDSEGGEP